MNWILLLVLLAALFLFVKTTNKGQNIWSYFIVAGAIMLLISILYVSTTADVSFRNLDGVVDFGRLYFSWFGKVVGNFGHITGNAVGLDWGVNSTNTNASALFN